MLSPLRSASHTGEEPIRCKTHPPGTEADVGKALPRETEALAGLDTPALLFKGLCVLKSAPVAFVLLKSPALGWEAVFSPNTSLRFSMS